MTSGQHSLDTRVDGPGVTLGQSTILERTIPGLVMQRMGTLLLACCLAGCGNPHGTVKVSGTVRMDGAAPPGPGRVTFSVVEPAAGFPHRPGVGEFGREGKYQATSFQPGDGLVPGSYRVKIECYQTPPNMEGQPVKSYIAAKYLHPQSSGYQLTVKPRSRAIVFDIDVTP